MHKSSLTSSLLSLFLDFASIFSNSSLLLLLVVSCKATMDRFEWMYRINRVLDHRYLIELRKFMAAAKAHCESLKRTTTICPCSRCRNLRGYPDGTVQSHLIVSGFVEGYTVWTSHGKSLDARCGASGVSSWTAMVNQDPVGRPPPSAAAVPVASDDDNNAGDYITVEELLENMADGADGSDAG
jgi:hypothetical protein